VLLTCAIVAPLLALEVTLTQDSRYAASARIERDLGAERLLVAERGPESTRNAPPQIDLGVVERRTARRVGWSVPKLAAATAVRPLARGEVEARATSTERGVVTPLANALAGEYLAEYRRRLRAALVDEREATARRARSARTRAGRRALRRRAERLDATAASGGEARVVARAGTAMVISEPRVARNVALAAAGGMLLGLLLAGVLDAIDRRRAPHRAPEPAEPDLLEPIDGEHVHEDARGDREMARFVALNMVLDGADREEVRRHLDEYFEVEGRDELVEEAYRRAAR
jgi:hypothetical protein